MTEDDSAAVVVPPSLSTMFIQSTDTLRQTELDPHIPLTWNDRPPLLMGPRGQPETPNLLKGVSQVFQNKHEKGYSLLAADV